ncbi:MAG: Hsp20/alpha crystallin family protein [Spirochaetales bacterium]|nr:Hsp20/alpha crystallin family protein [Spirochaetales bacterium]
MTLQRVFPKRVYDPWSDLRSLQEEINRLFDFDGNSVTGLFDRNATPAVDVVEGDDQVQVLCELPGVNLKDLEVTVTGNVLTIKGEKKLDRTAKDGGNYRQEMWEGSFQRTISLPETVDGAQASAEMKDGILALRVPKREEAKPKQISVTIH